MIDLTNMSVKKDTRRKETKQVVDKITQYMKKHAKENSVVFKNWGSSVGKAGRPDLEIAYNGQTWYIEAKDPQGRLSTLQVDKIEKYERAGIHVYVVDNFKFFLQKIWPIMNK